MIHAQERDTELSMQLYRAFAKSFKSVSEHAAIGAKSEGFHPTAFAVMEMLYCKGAHPIQQIGSSLLLQSGNVTYVIDKLEKRGCIYRRPCSNDRRVIYVELTPEGEALMRELYPRYAGRIDHAFSGLNGEEKAELIRLLKKMGMQAEKLMSRGQT